MNPQKLHKLIETHYDYVYLLILKWSKNPETAEDILQDTVVAVLRNSHQLRDEDKFKAWFCQIAMNKTRNNYRSARNHNHESIEGMIHPPVVEYDFETEYFYKDAQLKLAAKVRNLPARQRHAYELRINQDMNYKSVANEMNCAYDTAKANYRHALVKLKAK